MLTLVIGGAASGKSEFAEQLVLAAGDFPRTYIATMQPFDSECLARIEKHRRMRAQKHFLTQECYLHLSALKLQTRGITLLECVFNLAANEKYRPDGAGPNTPNAILEGVENLCAQSEQVIVVSGDVCSGGNRYAGDTDAYLRLLAETNRVLAAKADFVYEIVCGVPLLIKGRR